MLPTMNDFQAFDLLVALPLMVDPGPDAPDNVTDEDYDLQQMLVLARERFPVKFLSRCKTCDEVFDDEGAAFCQTYSSCIT
jgi:hypothetical protein